MSLGMAVLLGLAAVSGDPCDGIRDRAARVRADVVALASAPDVAAQAPVTELRRNLRGLLGCGPRGGFRNVVESLVATLGLLDRPDAPGDLAPPVLLPLRFARVDAQRQPATDGTVLDLLQRIDRAVRDTLLLTRSAAAGPAERPSPQPIGVAVALRLLELADRLGATLSPRPTAEVVVTGFRDRVAQAGGLVRVADSPGRPALYLGGSVTVAQAAEDGVALWIAQRTRTALVSIGPEWQGSFGFQGTVQPELGGALSVGLTFSTLRGLGVTLSRRL